MEYETLVLVPKTTPMQTNAGECAGQLRMLEPKGQY